ncbi:MAG: hypothetical protein WAU88_11715 [Candidatus Zixiibacteriota bacterium]
MQDREGDMHVLFPFYLNYHLSDLRSFDPAFPSPKIDALYVLLILSECFSRGRAPLSARIHKDLLAWEANGVLSAHNYSAAGRNELHIVREKLGTLPTPAQMYLGFYQGGIGSDQDLELGAMSLFGRIVAETQFNSDEPTGYIPSPKLVRQFLWSVEEMVVITKNLWGLSKHGVLFVRKDNRVELCLRSRLQSKTEDAICIELGFEKFEDYYQWQIRYCIDIDPKRFSNPYSEWFKACEFFGLNPDVSILDGPRTEPAPDYRGAAGGPTTELFAERRNGAGAVRPDHDAIEAGSDSAKLDAGDEGGKSPDKLNLGFQHSPDFRSIRLPNSRQLELTAKQSAVISVLCSTYCNGTPHLSQSHVIEEVYGDVSEGRLKRLFDNNEIYALLIEVGPKRGTVRIRTSWE